MADVYIQDKDDASTEALIGLLTTGVEKFGSIIEWLLKAGMSSPMLSAAATVIVANMFYRAKLIDNNTQLIIIGVVLTGVGIAVTSEIIQDFTKILNLGGNTNPSLLTPSGTVIVFGDSNNAQLNALLKTMKK